MVNKENSQYPAGTQYSGNIGWVFPQLCNVRDIQQTFREHFKGKNFSKSSRWKSCFCVKSLWFGNEIFLANSSNHEVMFSEYSRNISQMFVSKIFPRYPRNIVMKFLEVKKFKKLFCGLSCENFNTGSLLSCNVFTELYWNCFTFRVMFWKGSHWSLIAGKKFGIAQHYYNHYKSFPSGI